MSDENNGIALSGGGSLAIDPEDRAMRIADPNGDIELEIELRDTDIPSLP